MPCASLTPSMAWMGWLFGAEDVAVATEPADARARSGPHVSPVTMVTGEPAGTLTYWTEPDTASGAVPRAGTVTDWGAPTSSTTVTVAGTSPGLDSRNV